MPVKMLFRIPEPRGSDPGENLRMPSDVPTMIVSPRDAGTPSANETGVPKSSEVNVVMASPETENRVSAPSETTHRSSP